MAEYILEDEVSNDLAGVQSHSVSFGIGGKSIASVENIVIGAYLGHEEGVNVCLPKQQRDVGDYQGDMEILGLAQLTLMACPNVPVYVLIEMGPPEMKKEITSRCKHSLVSELVVSVLDER